MSRAKALLATLLRLRLLEDTSCLPPLLTEFTLFSDLPVEVRLKIWALVASEVRRVKLIGRNGLRNWKHKMSSIEGQSRHPAMLQVNVEAREEGCRFYTRCQEKKQPPHSHTGHSDHTSDMANVVYINFSREIFYH
jgi:hypothetical protein